MGSLFGGGGGGLQKDNQSAQNSYAGQKVGVDSAQATYQNTQDAQPGLRAATDFATGAGLQGYGQTQDYMNYLGQQRAKYGGLASRAVDDANNFNDADYRERYAQRAGEDVAGQVQNANQNLQRQLSARGISAGSGAAIDAMNNNQITGALGVANAQNMAREAARLEGIRLNDRAAGLVSQGANNFTQLGLQGATTGINAGAAPLNAKSTGLTAQNSGYATAGQLGSTAANAATNQFNANTNFSKADQESKQKASGAFGSDLGSLASTAFRAYMAYQTGGMSEAAQAAG